MKQRQLYIALDSDGARVQIEDVDKKGEFLCPYCRRAVIPKQGDKNVWHFCHKGEVCEYLNIKTKDGLTDSELNVDGGGTMSDVDIGEECKDFLCMKCKARFLKEEGVKWGGGEYVCKDCFKEM